MIVVDSPVRLDRRGSRVWLRHFARTTPGIVVLIALAVAASCVVGGVVSASAVNSRIAEHKAVLEHSEPFAYAAQNLYAALSAADAAAATAFLSGGIQTPLLRARYQHALAAAASALADATAGAPDAQTHKTLAEVSAQLTTYAGLVEAARANNLQEFPVGSGYLREASTLMQTRLLPSAQRVFDLAQVDQAQRRVASLPTAGLVLLGFVLVTIGVGSAIMVARTNRRFNIGLVAAGVVAALVFALIVTTARLAAGDIERGRIEGTERFGQLAEARILAQQARTEEILQLITRGDISASEKSFYGHIDALVAALGTGAPAATEAVDKWLAGHRKQVDAYRAGAYPAAVGQAIGTEGGASGPAFAVVESSLRDEIEATRATLRDRVADAGGYLAWTPTLVLVLMTAAAAFAAVGLWPRLKEFL
jgi:hypothetical protein